jgi:hypothetical protein
MNPKSRQTAEIAGEMASFSPPRRRFVQGLALGGVLAGSGLYARALPATVPSQPPLLSGNRFELRIGETPVNYTGRRWRNAVAVSHGMNEAFSTGSHAQYPPQPRTS